MKNIIYNLLEFISAKKAIIILSNFFVIMFCGNLNAQNFQAFYPNYNANVIDISNNRYDFRFALDQSIHSKFMISFRVNTQTFPPCFVSLSSSSVFNIKEIKIGNNVLSSYTITDGGNTITIQSNDIVTIYKGDVVTFAIGLKNSCLVNNFTNFQFLQIPSYDLHPVNSLKIGKFNVLNGLLSVYGKINSSDLNIGMAPFYRVGYDSKLYFGNITDIEYLNNNTDPLWISRYNSAEDASELRVNIGNDFIQPTITANADKPTPNAKADKFSIGTTIGTTWNELLSVNSVGNMVVNGRMKVLEVAVVDQPLTAAWPDFVFEENYKLMKIDKLEEYLKQNKHLPNVPSTKEVQKEGVLLGEMNRVLLQKVEELTLYIIEQQKRIENLEKAIKK